MPPCCVRSGSDFRFFHMSEFKMSLETSSESWLFSTDSVSRFVRLIMVDGKPPVRLLELKSRLFKPVRLPISFGIEPVMSLLLKSSSLKLPKIDMFSSARVVASFHARVTAKVSLKDAGIFPSPSTEAILLSLLVHVTLLLRAVEGVTVAVTVSVLPSTIVSDVLFKDTPETGVDVGVGVGGVGTPLPPPESPPQEARAKSRQPPQINLSILMVLNDMPPVPQGTIIYKRKRGTDYTAL